VSSMVSLLEVTGTIVAGIGGGVPAVRSTPPSVAAGAGGPSFALVSPGSGFWGRGKGPFYLGSATACCVDWWLRDVRGCGLVSWPQRLSWAWHGVFVGDVGRGILSIVHGFKGGGRLW
jgi:hypothetical protein